MQGMYYKLAISYFGKVAAGAIRHRTDSLDMNVQEVGFAP